MTFISVSYDKSKLRTPFIIWLLLFLLAGYCTFFANYSSGLFASYPMIIRTVFSTIFLIALVIVNRYIKRMFLNRKPLLVIDENGLTDNLSMFKLGFIPWSDIAYFYDYTNNPAANQFRDILKLELKEPEDYLQKLNSKIKEDLFARIISNGTSPVFFNTKDLDIEHSELLLQLQAGHESFNRMNR